MAIIWYVLLYSVLGYLLEVGYALWKTGSPKGRRMTLLLPMCPVYGLGSGLILSLPASVQQGPLLLMLCGAGLASAAEYGMGAFYERVCGVSFWDYRAYPFQLHGRICLRFSLCWGLLTLPLVYLFQPMAERLSVHLSPAMLLLLGTLYLLDFGLTALLLRRFGKADALDWKQLFRLIGSGWHDERC